jgi:hypothetical protein
MNPTLWLVYLCAFYSLLVVARPPLEVVGDERKLVQVADFGFLEGGQLTLTLEDYQVSMTITLSPDDN